jgi:lactate dehydrogenase-like 2-hydroxyacid dehydrogenase
MTEKVIAIGGYYDWDTGPMRATWDLTELDHPDAILDLPEADRAAVKAIAYKDHASLTGAHMAALHGLGIVSNYGVGYDSIDVAAAASRGIRVTNTPGVLNDDVADLAVGLLLAQSRQIVQASDWVRSGHWVQSGALALNRKMSGRKAGIMGLGRIGREIADRLAAFKMEIHYHSRDKKDTPAGWTYHADPVDLARAVDNLVVILVGGPDTAGYVSRDVLEALGPEGILVNVSRGSTVDEAALLDLLESGGLAGAALDVYASEPDIDPRFLSLDNVLLQPHQGSGTVQTRQAMGQLQRDNIAAFLSGKPLLTPVA